MGVSLPDDVARTVACSIVTSQIDYCNSLYAGMSASNFKKLHRVQNTLARVVLQLRRRDHITPALVQLHWLPVRHRVMFKITTITFNLLKFHRPSYWYQFVQPYTTSRNLRSLNQNLLVVNRAILLLPNDPSDILLLLFGTVYLPSAETVLDLLLRHLENISKLICSKAFMTTA